MHLENLYEAQSHTTKQVAPFLVIATHLLKISRKRFCGDSHCTSQVNKNIPTRRFFMRLTGKKIAILLAEGVEDLEFHVPMMRLQEEGAEVLAAGLDLKPVRGKNGLEIKPTTTIASLRSDELAALIVPGGWAPDKLRRYSVVTDLVNQMDAAGKVIAIICHGGLIPISAGILKGRKATGSLGIKDDLVNAGATWVDEAAFREGNLVWGRVVADIPDFCRELVAALV
jgi:protease I